MLNKKKNTKKNKPLIISSNLLKIINREECLHLQVQDKNLNEYQIDKSFIEEILKLFDFPLSILPMLSTETTENLLNDFLILYNCKVNIRFLDNSAKSFKLIN